MSLNRGFQVQHQRVVVHLDPHVRGTAILTILPLNPSLRTIYLDCSVNVESVTLSSSTEDQPLLDTPASWCVSKTRSHEGSLDRHPEVKRKIWAEDGDELAISVSGGWIRLLEGHQKLAPIEIRIDYTAGDGHVGAEWMPCVDDMWMRNTWELQFIVPRDWTVASSGELVEQIRHPHSSEKTIYSFLQTVPTSVQHIGYAAGHFSIKPISRKVVAFNADEIDIDFVTAMMTFYSTEFGTFPFQDLKIVFTDVEAPIILASLILLPPDVQGIDQNLVLRHTLSAAIAKQWAGISIIPRTVADTWIVNGLALYIHSLCLKHILGNNEYRFRLKRDIDRCVRIDQGEHGPLCVPGSATIDLDFCNLKAPLVLHILDRHIVNTGTSLGLSRVIPRIFLAALSDDLGIGNSLSTSHFFRLCRKTTGLDLGPFADQWVFGSGCPHFRIHTHFVRKKFVVELTVTQNGPAEPALHRTPFFAGSLTVRIHEADGAPFEHVIDIKTKSKTFNLPFNTKYKRTRRSGVPARYYDDEDELESFEAFTYPPWDEQHNREEWRVGEWDEEQSTAMMSEGGGYEWIRLDPECEWLAWFDFPEKPWYWVSQLQGDRDVVAQVQAVQFLTAHIQPVVASELAKVVLIKNYFYRVRMEAIKALVLFENVASDYGAFLLLKLFDELDDHGVIGHFIRRALISAIGSLKGQSLLSLEPSATVVAALGNEVTRETTEAIDKALTVDRLVPSHGNAVSRAGLMAHIKSVVTGQRTNDPKLFLAYTREGNLPLLRRLAVDCLLICQPVGRSAAVLEYLLDLVSHDSSIPFRQHVAVSMVESILLSVAVGELGAEDSHMAILDSIRRRFSNSFLIRAPISETSRLQSLKLGELVTAGVAETVGTILRIQTPSEPTPKIRLNLQEFPFPENKIIDADYTAMTSALMKLTRHALSLPFRYPVDPIRDGARDYLVIVKEPMDLQSINAKIDNKIYVSRDEFERDVRLIISNCLLYNPMSSPLHQHAKDFGAYFDKMWSKTVSTLVSVVPDAPKIRVKMPPPPVPKRKNVLDEVLGEEVDAIANARDPTIAPKPDKPMISIKPPRPPPLVSMTPPSDKLKKMVIEAPAPIVSVKPSKVVPSGPAAAGKPSISIRTKPDPDTATEIAPKLKADSAVDQTVRPVTAAVAASGVPRALPVQKKASNNPQKAPRSETPWRPKRARALLSVLQKDPNAVIFLRPVDPVMDQCPTYFDEIKKPMDLGTISKKIETKRYRHMEALADDIELVVNNCRLFNPPGPITALADNLEAVYKREWVKISSPLFTPEERKSMIALLNRAMREDVSFFFREAVDPIKLGIPQYFDVIPPDDARDLSLVLRHVKSGTYASARDVDESIRLMLDNARIFNGEGVVMDAANAFEHWWNKHKALIE